MSRPVRLAFVMILLAGGLAACGKRGPLEPPPGSEAARPNQEQAGAATTGARPAGETRIGGNKRVPITPPKRDLLIDRLLD